ncbi:hypothetical protein KC340_g7568 [Hortaea werneckii]|nr:hypothetical protein KC342_g7802 [Hortaea werneckii]KAI7108289.1 hypothetical protein KC339_g1673 [Hortaea werneckii]KAI7226493.1 hypothetical protein KC365_g9373 [Hortaea werneckii]KAI7320563.1 hypothetical protein KC340_g7568 [Hortaea werneckii]KAI7365102.1 hypothetical protein KC328_g18705 [Hortaea werneckii]
MDNRNHAFLAHFFLVALAYVFLVMDDEWTQFYVLFGLMSFQALGIIYDYFSPGCFDHFMLPRYLLHPYEPYYSRLARDAIAFGEELIYVFDIIVFAIYGELEQQDQQQQQVFEEKKESLVMRRAKGIVEDGDFTNKWEEYEAKKARERKQSEAAKASHSDQASAKNKPKRKSSKKSKRALEREEAESEALRQKWLDKLLIDTTKMNYNWGSGFGDPFEVDNGGPFEEDKNGRPIIPDWYIAEQKAKAMVAAAAKAEEERKQAEMAEKEEQAKIAAKLAAKKLQEDKAVADFKKTFGASSDTYVAWQCHYCNIHHHAIWAERAGHVRLFGKEPEPVIKTIFGNDKAMYCTCCGWPYNQPGQPVNHGFTAVAPSQNGGAAVVQPPASMAPPPPQPQQQQSGNGDAAGGILDPVANPLWQMDVRAAREAIRTTMLEVVSKTTEMQRVVRQAPNKRAAWQAIITNESAFLGNLAVVMQWIQEWAIPDKEFFDTAKIPMEEVKRLKLQVEVLQPMHDLLDDAPVYSAELAAAARRIGSVKCAEFARPLS